MIMDGLKGNKMAKYIVYCYEGGRNLEQLGLEPGQELSLEEVLAFIKLKDSGHISLNFAVLETTNDDDVYFAIDRGRFNQR